jgi:PAS domain S-box-containing protein
VGGSREAPRPGGGKAELEAEVARLRRAEEALRAASARAEALAAERAAVLAQLAEGVIVADPAGRVTFVNEAAARIHGAAPLGVPPEAYAEAYGLFTEDGRPYPSSELPLARAVLRGETVAEERWRIRRPDGTDVLAVGSARPLLAPDGARIGAVLTLRDDTARHAAERALREGEARLRALADNLPSGMVYQLATRRDGSGRRFAYVARSCGRLTGVPAADALADPGALYGRILPEDRPALAAAEEQAIRGLRPFEAEARLVHAGSGEVRWCRIASAPREMPDGSLVWDGLLVDVTERREAEGRVRRSEERYRSLFDSIDAGFCVLEVGFDEARRPVDYRFVEVNPAFERQTGLVGAEGRWMRELAPAHEQHWFDAYGRVALTGESVRFENRAAALGDRWFEVYAFPAGGPDAANRVAVLFNDISMRLHSEAALRESEARFQAIANSIDQMVWSTRPDGFHDFYNQRWYEFTGVAEGSTDGEAWSGVFHPDDRERAWATWRRCLETGEPYRIEYRLRHRSGQYRWVLGRAQPLRGEDGRVTRWFGTCTDIQDIVEAREVLARSREALEREVAARTAERDRMWRLSTDVMLVARFDSTVGAVNPAWTALLGWGEDETVGRPLMDLVHPDDARATAAETGRLSEGHTTARFENRFRHRDGSYRWFSWTAVPDERFIHAVGRDVTAEKERVAALRAAEDALRQAQKMEAVGQLTGGVAHDFNNLLTVIRSSADLLRRPDLPEERRRRYVDAIAETVGRAAKLTGQLLAFARRQALRPEVFDAGARVRAVADMLRSIVGARVRVATEVACEGCLVEADASQFETAVVNMAVNARDAMEAGGTLTMRVEAVPRMPAIRGHAGGGRAFVAVSLADTGAGISPDALARIFEPFFTTKEVGRGTGLGLSQVYGFAKQSGGDVAVESEVGRGTTFTLYLPRAERGPAAEAAAAGAGGAGPSEYGRGRRVLVVEDNAEVGAFSTQVLQDLGYETTWATNADEALARLAEGGRFDVVFSDVVMPGMGGVELGREIRRLHPGLPVVLTSGYSHVLAEEGRHGFELLHKPYAAEELSRLLRRAVARRRGAR